MGSDVCAEPKVAVCLVTHHSAADLPTCFAALEAQDYRPLELVIVDCASHDRSAETAREIAVALPRRVVALADNRGFSGGMNEAFRQTTAPLLLTLNADTVPRPDFVRRLVERLLQPGPWRVAAVTGRLTRPAVDGDVRLDACGMFLTGNWRHLDRGSGEIDRGQWYVAERVFGGTGAATLFARQALDDVAVDGEIFDERFHSFREDAELCFRLQARGWQVIYEPAASAEHRRRVLPERRRQLPAMINYHSLKNRYLLRANHQTMGNFWRTLLPTLTRDVTAFAYVLCCERSSLAAYRWLWRNRREIRARRRLLLARRTADAAAIDNWFRHASQPL